MGLEEDQQQDSRHRKVSDTGEENNSLDTQRQDVTNKLSVCSQSKSQGSNDQREITDRLVIQQSDSVSSQGCKTFLLTQAATLTTNHGLPNEVTPASVALLSPSSPPVPYAASPEAHSMDSPSHHTTSSHTSSPTSKNNPRKRGVPHIYRDFTNIPDTAGYVRKKTGGVTQPFPEKLHEMLDQVREPTIVSWLPHGRAFIVRKPKEFTAQIMPKFFRQSKLTSFQRQLNLYGFRRLTQGPDAGAYYHELFLRGRPQLCLRMQRQKVKGTGHKQPADAKTEPNFYSMAPSTYPSPTMGPMGACSPDVSSDKGDEIGVSTSRFEDMSPGMAGLHGAAYLLKNIAAGVKSSTIGPSFSLGESAILSGPQDHGNATDTASLSDLPLASLAVPTWTPSATNRPRTDHSMSLLGRVNMEPSSPAQSNSQSPSQSAFFWPPVRRTQDPPSTETEAASPPGILSSGHQQESAQPTSSNFVKRERANFQASERAKNWTEVGKVDHGLSVKIQNPNTPLFLSFGGSEETGRMETKVSNGIETEEV